MLKSFQCIPGARQDLYLGHGVPITHECKMTPNSVAAQQKLHVKRWIKKVNSAYFSKETLIILRTPVKIKQIMEMDGNGLLQFFLRLYAEKMCKDVFSLLRCFRSLLARTSQRSLSTQCFFVARALTCPGLSICICHIFTYILPTEGKQLEVLNKTNTFYNRF